MLKEKEKKLTEWEGKLNITSKKLDVIAALNEPSEKLRIELLCSLDYEAKLYKKTLEAFVERNLKMKEKIRPAVEKQMQDINDKILLLQKCLYNKEKNATERLVAFKSFFLAQCLKLDDVADEAVKLTTQIFLQNVGKIVLQNKNLFILPERGDWRFSIFRRPVLLGGAFGGIVSVASARNNC
ncbi:MAG: hypothetical protein ABI597_09420 [Gammaproteobacteria bacterium]